MKFSCSIVWFFFQSGSDYTEKISLYPKELSLKMDALHFFQILDKVCRLISKAPCTTMVKRSEHRGGGGLKMTITALQHKWQNIASKGRISEAANMAVVCLDPFGTVLRPVAAPLLLPPRHDPNNKAFITCLVNLWWSLTHPEAYLWTPEALPVPDCCCDMSLLGVQAADTVFNHSQMTSVDITPPHYSLTSCELSKSSASLFDSPSDGWW